jgi:hypothetical protein
MGHGDLAYHQSCYSSSREHQLRNSSGPNLFASWLWPALPATVAQILGDQLEKGNA